VAGSVVLVTALVLVVLAVLVVDVLVVVATEVLDVLVATESVVSEPEERSVHPVVAASSAASDTEAANLTTDFT
jgi:hypothetical protein